MEERKWYSIRKHAAQAAGDGSSPSTAEILIYGDIGASWYGESVTAKDFVTEIAAIEADTIYIRINSFGGSVADGIAIYNAIKRHPAMTVVTIDGVAFSIASLIAMAGDRVEMSDNALLMIHAPWGSASGNSAEMRKYADVLDTYADAMAASYAQKSGKPLADIMALLTDGQDHYYTADEAVADGFVDESVDAMPLAASFDRAVLAARFKTMPGGVEKHAAAAAQSSKEKTMKPEKTPAAPEGAAPDDDKIVQAKTEAKAEGETAGVKAEAARRDGIIAAFKPFTDTDGVTELQAACEKDTGCSVQDANAKLLAHLGKGAESVNGNRIVSGEDARDKFRVGAQAALAARAGFEADDRGNHLRGYSMMELAREALAQAGIDVRGKGKMEVVAAAFTHSGSDFPLLLANIAEKAMLKGYDEAEETFQKWTSVGVLGDFKAGKRVDLNSFPSLAEVPEGAEYKYATVGEHGETVQLATYGSLFSITRQAIINDDLGAFTKIPQRMGRAAIRTVGDLVYAILTGNPAMADAVTLFHANHSNIGTTGVIATASVDEMRQLMAKQTAGGGALNIKLANLIVPVALGGTARVVANSEFEVGASTKNNTTPNSVRGTFDVIEDARLDSDSAIKWYGAANPAMHDTIEVSYLDGIQTPTLEQQGGWEIDGVEFKVRMDAGVKALDYRTMTYNAGA